jgi:hypothetical protein
MLVAKGRLGTGKAFSKVIPLDQEVSDGPALLCGSLMQITAALTPEYWRLQY